MKRVFKNYATTVIGLIFMLGAAYVGIIQNDIERATFLGGYGLIFLRTKDSLIGLNAK